MTQQSPRLIAFYLPQFHPIPENDRWWGEGFTDWVNVRNARALFPGHEQPKVPHPDIGYYDPRDIQTLHKQVAIAKAHGVHGFCFYHYWFNGKKLLETPIETFLAAGEPDMPFCLSWANEPWTRAWDGRDRDVLMPQRYGGEVEWNRHFDYLLPFWRDPRAIRVDGKPVFLIYRLGTIANVNDMVRHWRARAEQAGLAGLHLVAMLTGFSDSSNFAGVDIDAVCEFFPTYAFRPRTPTEWLTVGFRMGLHLRALKRWTPFAQKTVIRPNYEYVWRRILATPRVFHVQYRGAFVAWDNSPRKGYSGVMVQPQTPDMLGRFLEQQLRKAVTEARHEPLVFLNSWNEWAEGANVEPNAAHGYAFLEATRAAIEAVSSRPAVRMEPLSMLPIHADQSQ